MGEGEHMHRGEICMALKTAAGLTAAGLSFLGVRHLGRKEKKLKSFQTHILSLLETVSGLEDALTHQINEREEAQQHVTSLRSQMQSHQADSTAKIEELQAAGKELANTLEQVITKNTAETDRLEGLIEQEKASAFRLGAQLREETRRLQERFDSLGAEHDAATRQHELYKQERDAEATDLTNGKEDLQKQLASTERSYAIATAESPRLDSEVTGGKAASDQAEDECWQLQEQGQDLQLHLQASELAASEGLAPCTTESGADAQVLLHDTADLQSQTAPVENIHAGAVAESSRLDSGVTGGKAGSDQAEDEGWQLQGQDLQLQLQASELAASEGLAACTDESGADAQVLLQSQLAPLEILHAAVDLQLDLQASEAHLVAATERLAATQNEALTLDAETDLTAVPDNTDASCYSINGDCRAHSSGAAKKACSSVGLLDSTESEMCAEKHADAATAPQGEREVEAYLALSASTSPAPSTCLPSKPWRTSWRPRTLASREFEAVVRAEHSHQRAFRLMLETFGGSAKCQGVYRRLQDPAMGLVGAGAHSKVYYLERQSGTEWQPVTMKQYAPHVLEQGKQELQGLLMARGLPRITQLVEAFTIGEASATSLIIITEYAEGQNLDNLLFQLSQEAGWQQQAMLFLKAVMRQVCEAVQHLHATGWCHGDLNVSNVRVKVGSTLTDVQATVMDLGGSMPRQKGSGSHLMVALHYSSPELDRLWTGACRQGLLPQPDMLAYDIWALGCVMVFVLTGQNAFDFGSTDFRDTKAAMERVRIQQKLWADKHAVVSLPMFCEQEPFCQIAGRATADSNYNSCWQLLRQNPQQDMRAGIEDVIKSQFMTAA